MQLQGLLTFTLSLCLGNADSDSPWVWTCGESRRACSRVLPTEAAGASTMMDLMECKMRCSHQEGGLLWPLPRRYQLSEELTYDLGEFTIADSSMDAESQRLLDDFYNNNFLQNIDAMRKDGGTETASVPVLLHLTAEEPFSHLRQDTDEGYDLRLATREDGSAVDATVEARNYFGLRHGLETLSQLFGWNARRRCLQAHQSAEVTGDRPEYHHRGVMVDTSRHFVPLRILAKVVDGMAANKLNHLHWHITDATSFPLELDSVPELARYGAYSEEQTYSPEEVRRLVDYATARGVKVVPELDMPRHAANGWQFGPVQGLGDLALCINELNPRCRGGICGHLNPVNDKLYDVLERVFREMGQLFPSDTFHLGADEVEFLCWRKTPEVRQWMEARGMDPDSDADMFELWSQFQRNATARLRAAAPGVRNVTLWTSSLTSRDDLESKVPVKGHLIQIWTDSKDETIPKLMEKNYTVIISNSDELYLDCGFGYYVGEGNSWCDPYKQWRTLYQHDPRGIYLRFQGSDPARLRQILGSEAPIWTESADGDAVETRLWPRASALAERLWTDPKDGDEDNDDDNDDDDGDDDDDDDPAWIRAERRFVHHRERMVERGLRAEAVQPTWCHLFEDRCRKIK